MDLGPGLLSKQLEDERDRELVTEFTSQSEQVSISIRLVLLLLNRLDRTGSTDSDVVAGGSSDDALLCLGFLSRSNCETPGIGNRE